MISERTSGKALGSTEGAVKIAGIRNSATLCNLFHRQFGEPQQLFGMIHATLIQILHNGDTILLFEFAEHVVFADGKALA